MEGYKFAEGSLYRLTRPQLMFMNRFVQFKIDMQKGGKKAPRGTPITSGTPEEIHARMWPKIQKQKEEGLRAEIAAAERVQKAWEEKQKGRRKG